MAAILCPQGVQYEVQSIFTNYKGGRFRWPGEHIELGIFTTSQFVVLDENNQIR